MNNILSIVWIFFMILNGTKGDQNEILNYLNHHRKESARGQSVSNMWKLSWDEEMVKIAEKWEEKEVDDLKNGEDYRLFLLFATSDSARHSEDHWNKYFSNLQVKKTRASGEDYFHKELHYNERFMTTQTKVGCVAYHKKYELWDHPYSFELLCAIGPNGYRREDGKPIQIDGKPGSNCGIGFNNGDGLCVSEKPTTVEPPTTKQTATSDQEFTTQDPKEEEWDLILYLNSAGGKGTLLGFFVVFFVILVV
ncbi:unnamed protein product [Caenorhabditis brenneri]